MRGNVWWRVLIPLMWVGLLVPWTWALLVPIPRDVVERVGGSAMSFIISKTLHGGVYATLGFLSLLLPLSLRWRLVVVALVIAHGGATEYLQQFVQRGSSWRDFALDTSGVLVGVGLFFVGRRYLFGVLPEVKLQADRAEEHGDAADLR